MPDIVTIVRTEHADSICIGTPGKSGELKVYFDSANLSESQARVDVAVQVRQHLLEKLSRGAP